MTTCESCGSASAKWAASVAVASLLALSGCTAVRVKLGMRVYLAKTLVSSMQASLPKGPAMAPGEKTPLVAQFTQPDGKVLVTEGAGKGKVLWSDLTVTPTLVKVDKKGVLTLPHDPRVSDGKTAHVAITVPSHPDLHADVDIPITYDYNFVANFSGGPGADGSNGMDGMAGSSGAWVPPIRIIRRRVAMAGTARTARTAEMAATEETRRRCRCK